jgi:electron transfer flavoprotein alpha/beta subunit
VKVVVCIKHIIGPTSGIGDADQDGSLRNTANPLDLSAVEEALRLCDAPRGEVIAISVGPAEADLTLRQALMMGVDRIVRVWDERLEGVGAYGVADALCAAAQAVGFDLILCGARSADSGGEIVGALMAEQLNLPLMARVVGLKCDTSAMRITADKKVESGGRETYSAPLPALVTIERGAAEPRYSSGPWVHRLLRGRVELLTLRGIGLDLTSSKERVRLLGITPPQPRAKLGVKVSGLSLKDQLAVMRGQAGRARREEAVDERPEDAARKIREHLEKWLA